MGDNPKPDHTGLSDNQIRLRHSVRFFYDLQKLRIQSGNRDTAGVDTVELDESDQKFLGKMGVGIKDLERSALNEIKRLLKKEPIWNEWLKHQRGVGPTMGGVICGYININRTPTASALWKWVGLAVVDGKADRRRKGQKCNYNPFLKAKMLEVLGKSFLKSKSPWKDIYDNRKTRRCNQLVPTCMACEGTGKVKRDDGDEPNNGASKKATKKKIAICANCEGTGGPAPWGKSDAHREIDARRVMVKLFLADLYGTWRELEGLPVREPYAKEYLGRGHHPKGGDGAESQPVHS